jgi:hypothetical protein
VKIPFTGRCFSPSSIPKTPPPARPKPGTSQPTTPDYYQCSKGHICNGKTAARANRAEENCTQELQEQEQQDQEQQDEEQQGAEQQEEEQQQAEEQQAEEQQEEEAEEVDEEVAAMCVDVTLGVDCCGDSTSRRRLPRACRTKSVSPFDVGARVWFRPSNLTQVHRGAKCSSPAGPGEEEPNVDLAGFRTFEATVLSYSKEFKTYRVHVPAQFPFIAEDHTNQEAAYLTARDA